MFRSPGSTRFLASVRDPDEARVALAAGADIVDAKDPDRGALGALDPHAIRKIVAAVGGRATISAVTGDLPVEATTIAPAIEAVAATGVDLVKVGLFPGTEREATIHALGPLATRFSIVGVLFADAGYDPGLLPHLADAGFHGAMIDTATKDGRTLRDHLDRATLAAFVAATRQLGLMSGLAGSLRLEDAPPLLALGPDALGFRGALCDGGRGAALDPARVAAVRAAISAGCERVLPQRAHG